MCIIVFKPTKQEISKDVLDICWKKNSDGCGYMFAENRNIIIEKSLDSFDNLWKQYQEDIISKGKEKLLNVVWHFRIRTHGTKTIDNVHPFYINNGQEMAFCHNGTITQIDADKENRKSDTKLFADRILSNLPKRWLNNVAIMTLMMKYVGTNKFAFLNKEGIVNIINEDAGEWNKGIWYSNSMYKDYVNTYNYNRNQQDNAYGFYNNNMPWIDQEDIDENDSEDICTLTKDGVKYVLNKHYFKVVNKGTTKDTTIIYSKLNDRYWDYQTSTYNLPIQHSSAFVRDYFLGDCYTDKNNEKEREDLINDKAVLMKNKLENILDLVEDMDIDRLIFRVELDGITKDFLPGSKVKTEEEKEKGYKKFAEEELKKLKPHVKNGELLTCKKCCFPLMTEFEIGRSKGKLYPLCYNCEEGIRVNGTNYN